MPIFFRRELDRSVSIMPVTKQHILEEIRRTATANGGTPLGTARFDSETGIKTSDCLGKFWARRSDARQEAGYAPNKMQSRHDDSYLFEQLIPLIRKLRKFPATNDMRLWNREHPGSPNFKTYFTRFRTKNGIVQKVAEYCRAQTELSDIVEFCEKALGSGSITASSSKSNDRHLGYVYLIKSGRYYKIGKTNSLGRREYELALQLPDRANTAHSIKTDDPSGIEAYWHKRFHSKRKNGEWFELDSDDIEAFRRRKFM